MSGRPPDFVTRTGVDVTVRLSECEDLTRRGIVVLVLDGEPYPLYPSDVGRVRQLLSAGRKRVLRAKRDMIENE